MISSSSNRLSGASLSLSFHIATVESVGGEQQHVAMTTNPHTLRTLSQLSVFLLALFPASQTALRLLPSFPLHAALFTHRRLLTPNTRLKTYAGEGRVISTTHTLVTMTTDTAIWMRTAGFITTLRGTPLGEKRTTFTLLVWRSRLARNVTEGAPSWSVSSRHICGHGKRNGGTSGWNLEACGELYTKQMENDLACVEVVIEFDRLGLPLLFGQLPL
jgi:hypothetical protein